MSSTVIAGSPLGVTTRSSWAAPAVSTLHAAMPYTRHRSRRSRRTGRRRVGRNGDAPPVEPFARCLEGVVHPFGDGVLGGDLQDQRLPRTEPAAEAASGPSPPRTRIDSAVLGLT